ncbi:peroxiredoxin family protein [Sphingobacterium pedocola]|nr:TlpA disulfide reductase family protein [Sphingobacterium pedocola]
MKKAAISLSVTVLILSSWVEKYTSTDYLRRVLGELENIESATFWTESQSWNPGDTSATHVINQYVESYRNSLDTTLGASWATFDTDQKAHLEFAYDGKMRALRYDDEKEMVIDSFNVRKLPFRPVATPFYNYTENIVRYILENKDSTSVELKDVGDDIYLKLSIYEDRQVEFFGKARYIPRNPLTFDPTSIYELWINKETNLPYKVRREMEHNISVISVSDFEFNKLRIENFTASDYFPKDYQIRQYGEKGRERLPNKMVNTKAPDWILQTANNRDFSLSDVRSKVILLQFTSVSCGPCNASIPFLKQLATEYNKADFDLVAIECTSKNSDVLKKYMSRNRFDYKFLLASREVLNKYSISLYPMFFILDEDRIIRKVIYGYGHETDSEVRTLINSLI